MAQSYLGGSFEHTVSSPSKPGRARSRGCVVAFLAGDGVNCTGERLDEVLDSSNADLEIRHDVIQWLFPLSEPSQVVPASPVLDAGDIEAIQNSSRIRANLLGASERMKRFYSETAPWREGPDHNHLRITRIIRSLRLLAGDSAAEAFKRHIVDELGDQASEITRETLRYWNEA